MIASNKITFFSVWLFLFGGQFLGAVYFLVVIFFGGALFLVIESIVAINGPCVRFTTDA